jgi:sedoheptulose-bisphosphatase
MSTQGATAAPGATIAAAAELGFELGDALRRRGVRPRLSLVAEALAESCAKIAEVLRGGAEAGAGSHAVGSQNAFGDAQLEVDLRTEDIIVDCLRECRAVATISSEEQPVEHAIDHDSGDVYSVAFDPLDGSSIIEVNWAVGTIVRLKFASCQAQEEDPVEVTCSDFWTSLFSLPLFSVSTSYSLASGLAHAW